MKACEELAKSLGALFTCSQVNGSTRIRTPFLYPDGDVIDVFVDIGKESSPAITISDYGETLRWLRTQSTSLSRSPKQTKLIDDVCQNHGLELFRGMLQARVSQPEKFAETVIRVAQGALRVADVWFTMRTRSVESATDEVETFLTEKKAVFDKHVSLIGRSGKTWTIDFNPRTSRKSSLVFFLSTGSKAAARMVSEHVVAAWYDLSNLKVGPEARHFISLFDDTIDIWNAEDFKLLEDLSSVKLWSKPEEFWEAINN